MRLLLFIIACLILAFIVLKAFFFLKNYYIMWKFSKNIISYNEDEIDDVIDSSVLDSSVLDSSVKNDD